jgi:hypothetical protein
MTALEIHLDFALTTEIVGGIAARTAGKSRKSKYREGTIKTWGSNRWTAGMLQIMPTCVNPMRCWLREASCVKGIAPFGNVLLVTARLPLTLP